MLLRVSEERPQRAQEIIVAARAKVSGAWKNFARSSGVECVYVAVERLFECAEAIAKIGEIKFADPLVCFRCDHFIDRIRRPVLRFMPRP